MIRPNIAEIRPYTGLGCLVIPGKITSRNDAGIRYGTCLLRSRIGAFQKRSARYTHQYLQAGGEKEGSRWVTLFVGFDPVDFESERRLVLVSDTESDRA